MRSSLVAASFVLGLGALLFPGCSTDNLSASAFDASDGAFDSDKGPQTDAELGGFNDASKPSLPDGSPEAECAKSTSKQGCRLCCHTKYSTGRAVYITAVNECICQPSKCGNQCANSLCKATPTNPVAGDPCIACFNAEAAGTGDAAANPPVDAAVPPSDGGSFYPERNIVNCAAWANDRCRNDAECLKAETCKVLSGCNDKPDTTSADASRD